MPQPGVPYRPIVAVPQKLTEMNPFFKICTAFLFTALDPPQALVSESAVLPPVAPSYPKPAPVPSPTQDPGARDPIITAITDPVPGHVFWFPGVVPTAPFPPATITPATISDQGSSKTKLQPDDPTAHNVSPSLFRPSPVDTKDSSDPKQGGDPQQSSETGMESGQKLDPSKPYLPPKVLKP